MEHRPLQAQEVQEFTQILLALRFNEQAVVGGVILGVEVGEG